ncbi:SPOR domain-containing protein [Pleionea sp. CnH1-48]|uniref:SPOR domain-containing protein n=1 Tax=Pleionea sp. CnH1-48 TaxID=2954494 RepID=UPI00209859AB|nr:SPOR domain-containing protein [Pleionea sp. CnH1-48]MCO7226077.1 SPOR domain-containing protein [Pleionea sp. CnH1-48]
MGLDQTIKQRLVGAIVLIALAIIFLPGILGQKNVREPFASKIPEQPVAEQTQQTTNTQPANEPEVVTDKVVEQKTVPDATQKDEPKAQVTSKKPKENTKSTTPVTKKVVEKPSPAKKEPTPVAAQTKPDTAMKQSGWVVQVGSFSSRANAEVLAKKLEASAMKAFVRHINIKQKKLLYRVYVGPWLKKEPAQNAVSKIEDITRLKPIVARWQPNIH